MSDPNATPPESAPNPPPAQQPAAPQQPASTQPPAAPQQPGVPQQQPPPQYAQQPPPQYAQQQPPPQYAQQAPQQQYAAAAPLSPEADKNAAMWAHIGGIVGFLPSLIIWLVFKDRGPRTDVEAKEALNWQITFTIVYVALWIVVGILSGILFAVGAWGIVPIINLLPWILWILNVVFSIMGGVKVNGGGSYRYPVNFRFIK